MSDGGRGGPKKATAAAAGSLLEGFSIWIEDSLLKELSF